MDYISRENALDCISSKEHFYPLVKCSLDEATCNIIRHGLSEIPAENVQPVRYACNKESISGDFKCSACGKITRDYSHNHGYFATNPHYNYCPYCGAVIVDKYQRKEKWEPWEGKCVWES